MMEPSPVIVLTGLIIDLGIHEYETPPTQIKSVLHRVEASLQDPDHVIGKVRTFEIESIACDYHFRCS